MARDTYLVFDPEDRFHACICFGEAEAKEIIGHFDCPAGLRVRRITEGEPVRDVTADLISEDDEAPEYPAWEREASRGDWLYQAKREGAL
jgi:hypothetical protein